MLREQHLKPRELNRIAFALALVVVGVVGRVLLFRYANFETVLVVSLLAGALLGRVYALAVPLSTMAISDAVIYLSGIGGGYGIITILGISLFTWTGYLFVSFLGTRLKGRVICITKSIALVTGVGMIATVAYDIWTTIGYWYFLMPHTLGHLGLAFLQLTPFAIYHLMSSLMFIPLFGTIFIYIHENGIPALRISPIERESGDESETTEAYPVSLSSCRIEPSALQAWIPSS